MATFAIAAFPTIMASCFELNKDIFLRNVLNIISIHKRIGPESGPKETF